MRLGIMQPYFLPYIGYFQLIAAVDKFVLYDDVEFTKKGWINRNRMLQNGSDKLFTIPLAKAPDTYRIGQREISPDFSRSKLLRQFEGCYLKAPYFSGAFPVISQIVSFQDNNLYQYIEYSIRSLCDFLNIDTEIVKSSSLAIDQDLRSQDRVLAICELLEAETYINPIGGIGLYSKNEFERRQCNLRFIKSEAQEYPQFENCFVPSLSILDVLSFNSVPKIKSIIENEYQLIDGI